ncbi:Lrp/AsnC family transcriptional regulator [Tistrella sp. BH-R2-4]|uniref:Lrp/AsnC family transcriptional regulator n=1 Tax=Tistrella arctica TaxID=3133430 RepID=A0ABU9YRJ3_9PROT
MAGGSLHGGCRAARSSPAGAVYAAIRILKAPQADGRLSNQDLSAAVGLSPSPCWRRVRRLEELGVIRGYSAQLDRRAVGLACQIACTVDAVAAPWPVLPPVASRAGHRVRGIRSCIF